MASVAIDLPVDCRTPMYQSRRLLTEHIGPGLATHRPALTTGTMAALLLVCLLPACAPAGSAEPSGPPASPALRPEALSLSGRPLYRPPLPPQRQARLQAELDSATENFRAHPNDPDALLWVGRRLAYLGQYREAIAAFTRGIALHGSDARFYRHRGHRYITCRQFDLAIADLLRAANLVAGKPDEPEPDGQPNAAGASLGTLQGNIYYHLALAHYLRHEFAAAVPFWQRARALARSDDLIAATSYWLYLTERRLGRPRAAAEVLLGVPAQLHVTENQAYYDLLRLFRGDVPVTVLAGQGESAQAAAYRYGIASWYLLEGDTTRAEAVLRDLLGGTDWAAFGYIAAEAELERAAPAR